MILLLTPVDNPNLHVQVLSALATEFSAEGVTDKIANMASAQEVMDYFSEGKTAIPDYLKAGDLMEQFPDMLQEADSILDAVKKFAVTRSEELPVVDNAGDLRGVLSLSDLFQYSLPEHLLWLEDLSPIYELQPFSDMLKTADETKVADIMREEFVKAEITDPAVKLAKIFLMNKLQQLVIVDSANRPAGVVTLKNFSAKLFWD
jgi:CBS domain-containing protein